MNPALPTLLLFLAAVTGCDHTNPVDPGGNTEDRAPFSNSFPRQLTFNRGGDVDPTVTGGRIIFSRRPIPQADSDWCLGFLPIEGGVLSQETVCPDNGAENGTKEALLQPAVSPDGQSIALVEEIGSTSSFALAPNKRLLMVGSANDPLGATELLDVSIELFRIQGPFNTIPANSIHRLRWRDNTHLTFIAGTQRNLAGQSCCDTLYVPMALIEVDVRDGSWMPLDLGPLPPSDYYVTTGGAIRFTEAEDPAFAQPPLPCAAVAPVCPRPRVMQVAADGTISVLADFSGIGQIDRMFATESRTYVLTFSNQLFEFGADGVVTSSTFARPGNQILDMVFSPAGDLAVALVDPPATPSNLWLLSL